VWLLVSVLAGKPPVPVPVRVPVLVPADWESVLPNQGRVPPWQGPQVPPEQAPQELGSRWERTQETRPG